MAEPSGRFSVMARWFARPGFSLLGDRFGGEPPDLVRRAAIGRSALGRLQRQRIASDGRRGPNAFPETYFGTTEGFPPGLPGGGMTGVVPGLGTGAGAVISGSILAGGRIQAPGG